MRIFADQQRFPHAVDHLLALYGDPQFMIAKLRELGHEDVVVLEHVIGKDQSRMRLGFMYPLNANLPKLARRWMKKRTEIVQTIEWDFRLRGGRITIHAKGAPMRMQARVRLEAGGASCVADLVWEVHCGIPVIGSQIESLLEEATIRMSAADQVITNRLLQAA